MKGVNEGHLFSHEDGATTFFSFFEKPQKTRKAAFAAGLHSLDECLEVGDAILVGSNMTKMVHSIEARFIIYG